MESASKKGTCTMAMAASPNAAWCHVQEDNQQLVSSLATLEHRDLQKD